MAYERLPESVQTLYAELLELAIHAAAARAAAGVPGGSFVRKEVKGRVYWYLQLSAGGRRTQRYLGPESPSLLAFMEKVDRTRTELAEDDQVRSRLCSMLAAGGATVASATMTRVLELLAEAGVFRLGGVLVGTHAFAAYANMLGVRFDHQAISTQDVDVAQDPVIGIALMEEAEAADVERSLADSGLGFHAVPSLDPRRPSTSFKVRGRELRVDFLTPLHGPDSSRPVYLPAFGVSAQPLRLLDYLIEDPVEAVAVSRRREVLVNVPDPARFALHKLWTSKHRDVAFKTKATKDVRQAGQLLELLLDERPEDLRTAREVLAHRYPKAFAQVASAAEKLEPAVRTRLLEG